VSTFALDQLQAQLPGGLEKRYFDRTGSEWGVVARPRIADVARFVKDKLGFKLFIQLEGVDGLNLGQEPRFEVIYVFFNIERNEHVRLKVMVPEDDCSVPTIKHVFQGADWAERLTWDFYGVTFVGHGDLRRMLTYEEFKGHPLRKDYDLRGRQPLTPERPIKDIFRGPGTNGVVD